MLCTICEKRLCQELIRYHRPPSERRRDQHFYLIPWRGENELVSALVYRLKGDLAPEAWGFYATLTQLILEDRGLNFKRFRALVPMASARGGQHAHRFAQALGRALNKPVLDLLESVTTEQQKTKSREERKGARFKLKRPHTVHFTRLLFIDDLLTTGESFLQASRLFTNSENKDEQNAILTLFYRYANPSASAIQRP